MESLFCFPNSSLGCWGVLTLLAEFAVQWCCAIVVATHRAFSLLAAGSHALLVAVAGSRQLPRIVLYCTAGAGVDPGRLGRV